MQARIVAGRLPEQVDLDAVLQPSLSLIAPPDQLIDADRAIARLGQAVVYGERIGILTDYDADGLTSHAVIKTALLRYGVPEGLISSWIGHRLEDGYGISETLVDRLLANESMPEIVISADCGSSDHATIASLAEAGINVNGTLQGKDITISATADSTKWVQIDLGEAAAIDRIEPLMFEASSR